MIIRTITKSKQRYADQYRVYFHNGSCLTLSTDPDGHCGFSHWSEYIGLHDGVWEEAMENNNQLILLGNVEVLMNFSDLPSIIKSHIEKRISDAEGK